MLLVIDIGNTQITLGIFENSNLVCQWDLSSLKTSTEDEYGIIIYNLLIRENIQNNIKGTIISSVVSNLTCVIKRAIEKYLNIIPLIVSNYSNLGQIKLCVDKPKEVGADRICNIVGANKYYDINYVVVDTGTATTFDVVNSKKEFIGGSICAGIGLNAKSLGASTSLLPEIKPDYATKVIATNTITNILSGIIIGHAAMIDGLLDRIEEELGQPIKTIVTGGYSIFVKEHMKRCIDLYQPKLTIEGLKILYDLNKV